MASLTLKFKDKILNEYFMDCRNTFAIGRRTANDVVIVNLSVSGYHAEIIPADNGYLLKDLNSKNGTKLNGKRIKSAMLTDGDLISIGKHILVFKESEGHLNPGSMTKSDNSILFENPNEPVDQTVIIDTARLSRLQAIRSTKLNGFLELLNSGKGIALNKQLIKIGKNPESDIVVEGFLKFLTGETAATISRRPDGYYISALEGFLKPKVNNQTLKRVIKLHSLDIIRIGSFKMKFILR